MSEKSELERVQAEHASVMANAINHEDAAKDLIDYTKKTPDPFWPEYTGENPWVGGKGGGGGGCAIL